MAYFAAWHTGGSGKRPYGPGRNPARFNRPVQIRRPYGVARIACTNWDAHGFPSVRRGGYKPPAAQRGRDRLHKLGYVQPHSCVGAGSKPARIPRPSSPVPGGSVQKGGPQPPFGLVVLRGDCQEGKIESPLLTVSFGSFLHEQKSTAPVSTGKNGLPRARWALAMTGRNAQPRFPTLSNS